MRPAPPSFYLFDCEAADVPPGTLAAPRPRGRERQLSLPPPERGTANDLRGRVRVPAGEDSVLVLAGGSRQGLLYRLVNQSPVPVVVVYTTGGTEDAQKQELGLLPGNSVDIEASRIECRLEGPPQTASVVEYYNLGGPGRKISVG